MLVFNDGAQGDGILDAAVRIWRKSLLILCLLYLALPNVLFFWGWVEPYVAWPTVLGIGWCLWRFWKRGDSVVVALSRKDFVWLGVIGVFWLVQQWMVGYTGFFPLHSDFVHLRNPMYANLAADSWPVVLPDGRGLTYYLAAWLPPALASKAVGGVLAMQWWFLVWNWLGLMLASMAAFICLRRISVIFIFVLLALQDVFPAVKDTLLDTPSRMFFPGLQTQLMSTINHAVPTLIASVFVCVPGLAPAVYMLAGSLLLLSSPFGAMGVLPFMLLALWRSCSESGAKPGSFAVSVVKTWEFAVACIVACVAVLYFMRADSGAVGMYWALSLKTTSKMALLIRVGVQVVILAALWGAVKRWNAGMLIALCFFFFLPLVHIGAPTGVNELLFKAILPAYLVLALAYTRFWDERRWFHPSSLLLIGLIGLFLLGMMKRVTACDADLGCNEPDVFRGHVFHPGTQMEQSVCPTKPALMEGVFYRRGGEGWQNFPLMLFPSDTCVDYSLPARRVQGYEWLLRPVVKPTNYTK